MPSYSFNNQDKDQQILKKVHLIRFMFMSHFKKFFSILSIYRFFPLHQLKLIFN